MPTTPRQILRTYLSLSFLATYATSLIWGINTLFLLAAGLSITEAFVANAAFNVAQVVFEIPTGVIADTWGRRTSYLLGSLTLMLSTFAYLAMWYIHAPLWAWILSSMVLGLGYTFFSGATEAWLVDALKATNYTGTLESAFAKNQIVSGTAMLSGAISGGVIAQVSNLGVPYIIRSIVLGITLVVAFILMKDIGFTPRRTESITKEVRGILKASLDHGLRNPPVRWMMLGAPFAVGVSGYAFYAMQPYLLELYGKSGSYAIAGLATSIIAGAQIAGGLTVPFVRRLFRKRTNLLFATFLVSTLSLIGIGIFVHFWVVLVFLVIWAVMFAVSQPVRQAYINDLIPSAQRATVLSSDNLLGSAGGAVFQPALGKSADVWSYPASFVITGIIHGICLPFILLAKRENVPSDTHDRPSSPVLPKHTGNQKPAIL